MKMIFASLLFAFSLTAHAGPLDGQPDMRCTSNGVLYHFFNSVSIGGEGAVKVGSESVQARYRFFGWDHYGAEFELGDGKYLLHYSYTTDDDSYVARLEKSGVSFPAECYGVSRLCPNSYGTPTCLDACMKDQKDCTICDVKCGGW